VIGDSLGLIGIAILLEFLGTNDKKTSETGACSERGKGSAQNRLFVKTDEGFDICSRYSCEIGWQPTPSGQQNI
jgi:hypothetical protein